MSPESAAYWMKRCLLLAANADSSTSPNPRVGCVILSSEGKVIGEGWHRCVGEPHAETEAMNQVRSRHGAEALQGATLIVNLEPCNHLGRTPPCSQGILEAGISRVVVGMRDPNPTATGGIAHLRAKNVEVMTDVLQPQCYRFNEAFAHWHIKKRPFLTLKLAQTLDGCIATATGESQWITGKAARTQVHLWRREHPAILVGSGTARTDNPHLTVRHVSGMQPFRIVLDGEGTLPETLNLFHDEWTSKTIAVTKKSTPPGYASQLIDQGGRVIMMESESRHVELSELICLLANELQIQSILVEAGPRLSSALLRQNQIDRLRLFLAPKLIGNGLRTFEDLGVKQLAQSITFADSCWETVGDDQLFTGYRHPVPA